MQRWVPVFLRVALGVSFLSAVADRFGLWGSPSSSRVVWGTYGRFVVYVARVHGFLPSKLAPFLAFLITALQVALGVLLLAGWRLRELAIASGALLLSFGIAMTVSLGLKPPIDASVWTAAAGAFALALLARGGK